ncbi:MAG TPA: FAD-dependent oxidoreductase, partial [Vicinamibacteria bacterium]|nr:FAD-dependent oxidoreductase [Vicinamibacteria bacterium]
MNHDQRTPAGETPFPRRPRVVILGGGFGGVYTALALERALRRREDFEVVLVNRENYFVFQPMLPEVISGTIGITDVVNPIRRLLPRTTLHLRDVEAVDLERRRVVLSPGFRPHAHELSYDHLVLALGNVTDFRGLPGLPEHAMPFKNLGDALALRNHVIRCLAEAAVEDDDEGLRKELVTFVVAGGGFSGVEVAAELNDFVRAVAPRYRGIRPEEVRVVLLHSQERILPEMAEPLALFAQRILGGRGVEIRLKTRLAAATGASAVLAGGERIATRTLVSTVPSSPHPLVERLALPKAKGRVVTNGHLAVEGHPGLWALGDCAQVTTPDGALAPPTAQHAIREAEVAARNIVASLRGGERRVFAFKGLGKMGSLGHRSAVAEVFGLRLSGFLAWWLWRTVYLSKMPGWGRRLRVAVDWTLDLILPPELVQLRLGSTRGLSREHYEPGQEVFRQGELGDRLYLVLSGEVDVVREEGGVSRVLARLGPGQWFGEMALLHQTVRTASVRCAAPLDVLSLPREEFSVLAAH